VNETPRFKLWRTLLLVSLALAAITLPWLIVVQSYAALILTSEEAPTRSTAIVFGAGLRRDGRPTAILADRVRTAVDLYRRGKAQTLLLSGSATPPNYDEPGAMHQLALELGVAEEHLLIDRGGSRTFETCLRARDEFGIREAILVSQEFHLPRALAICAGLDLQAVGVSADLREYHSRAARYWELREIPATLVAFWDLHFTRLKAWAPSRGDEIILQEGPNRES
jgi:SanA protein